MITITIHRTSFRNIIKNFITLAYKGLSTLALSLDLFIKWTSRPLYIYLCITFIHTYIHYLCIKIWYTERPLLLREIISLFSLYACARHKRGRVEDEEAKGARKDPFASRGGGGAANRWLTSPGARLFSLVFSRALRLGRCANIAYFKMYRN